MELIGCWLTVPSAIPGQQLFQMTKLACEFVHFIILGGLVAASACRSVFLDHMDSFQNLFANEVDIVELNRQSHALERMNMPVDKIYRIIE